MDSTLLEPLIRPDDVAAPPARIADVERTTGVPRATLRIWERRYGFPQPRRDARGERYYLDDDILKLRLLGELVARGRRPGALIPQSVESLQSLLAAPVQARFGGEPIVRLLQQHDPSGLSAYLLQQLALTGLERFVCDTVPDLNATIGDAWSVGELKVHEEHLYTETISQVLRSAIAGLPPALAHGRPRVMMATLPHEQHGLGLLLVECMLRLEGCPCIPLGLNVPVDQLIEAAPAYRADVLALSLSSSTRPREAAAQLRELRRGLPEVALWIGGAGARFEPAPAADITIFDRIEGLRAAIAALRPSEQPEGPTPKETPSRPEVS